MIDLAIKKIEIFNKKEIGTISWEILEMLFLNFRTVKYGNQFGSIFGPVDLGEAVSTLYPNHELDEWLERLKEQNKVSAESVTADPIGEVDDNAIKIGFIVRVYKLFSG